MYGGVSTDPRFAPLLYPSHAGLPPAYIHVMELDPLRDDGVVYEKALRASGVKTRIKQCVYYSLLFCPRSVRLAAVAVSR